MIKPKLPRTIGTSIASLSLAFVGLSFVPLAANAQIDRLDHFRCYEARDFLGEPIADPNVLLFDQFDRLDQQIDFARLFSPFWLCNPVEKTTPDGQVTRIIHETNHLVFYPMLDFPSGPDRDVIISNQFGEQRMQTLGRALALAVPTEKNGEGEWVDLDHLKCYRARGGPIGIPVRLRDQFFPGATTAEVLEPLLLCNPTIKLHAGELTRVENPEAHLVCYVTTRTPYQDLVTARNQFAKTELEIRNGVSLCVPSKKQVVGGPRPDLTIELTNPARVFCPGGGGTCTQEMDYRVDEIAGVPVGASFTVEIANELGQSATVVIPGIGAGGSVSGTLLLLPAGDNCYNPDCTTKGFVDIPLPGGVIPEADETNNTDVRTDLG